MRAGRKPIKINQVSVQLRVAPLEQLPPIVAEHEQPHLTRQRHQAATKTPAFAPQSRQIMTQTG